MSTMNLPPALPGNPAPHPGNSPQGILALLRVTVVWLIPALILVVLVAVVTGLIFLPVVLGLIMSPFFAVFFAYAVQWAVVRARQRNGELILSYLETAVRLNLPLTPFLLAAQRSETGSRRAQLHLLGERLWSGMPVAAALAALPDVPQAAVARVAAAEPLGQMRRALRRSLERPAVEEERDGRGDKLFYRFYPIYMIFAIGMLLTGFMIFIVPKFKEIFKDFKVSLPPLTQHLLEVVTFINDDAIVVALITIAAAAVFVVALSVFMNRAFMPAGSAWGLGRWLEWWTWRLPVYRSLQRDEAMAETCEMLSDALREGVPLPAAVERATALPVNGGFKQQLTVFRTGLEAGLAPAAAARKAQLPDLLVGLLIPVAAANDVGADLFGFLGRYYRQKFSRTIILARAAFEPAMVLFFGTLVMIVVVAMFQPLVVLIGSVSGSPNGGAL